MADPTQNQTQDVTQSRTWDTLPGEPLAERVKPGLRLLYHVDLARIGALSHPDIPLAAGEWQIIGRKEPLFIAPSPQGKERPLDDPTISREQLKLRWLPEEQRFAITPLPGAKRKLHLVEMAGSQSGVQELSSPALAAPGCCIAIEDRVLLGLEAGQLHEPDEDRLGLIGESQPLRQLRGDIREVAEFRRPVLILGQTGVGKELVARAIHQKSSRARGPFLTVNCAALPENLVESILFGHKKGAFTGAEAHQEGMFRAADGGTLFLDELGEMPISVQPKLLRVLQDSQVFAVGQHKGVSVDVRLLAATNREPEREIAAGRLREDLHHRVAAHIIRVPPLRERRFDIPGLFIHFLSALGAEHPKAAWLFEGAQSWRRTIPMAFFLDLMRCDFSGNVRELENMAERTARRNLSPGPFRAPDLPAPSPSAAREESPPLPERSPPGQQSASQAASGPTSPAPADAPQAALAAASQALGLAQKTVSKLLSPDALEQIFLQNKENGGATALTARLEDCAAERLFALLVEHHFKQRNAAAALGVSPSTLIKLMQRFDLPRPADLSLETIQDTVARTGGDLDAAAQALKVSPQALKRCLTLLGRPLAPGD